MRVRLVLFLLVLPALALAQPVYYPGARWKDRQILSKAWIERALTPTATNRQYVVLRWIDSYRSADEVLKRVVDALRER